LKNTFPRISDARIIKGVYVGPHTTQLIPDVKFEHKLREVKKAEWKLFKMSISSFWEIIKQRTIVTWWLNLYNPTKLWAVRCLEGGL